MGQECQYERPVAAGSRYGSIDGRGGRARRFAIVFEATMTTFSVPGRASTVSLLASILLAACGGGGGDNGGGPAPIFPPEQPPAFASALDFEDPSSFINGESYYTDAVSIAVRGELNSVFIPRGYCPDSQPPQDFRVEWRNETNGQSGSSPVGIACVTNYLFGIELPGIASAFLTDSFDLALGDNRIVFDTYEGAEQIGRDTVTIVREDRIAPQISFSYPADGADGIAIDHALLVLFDEPMDATSLTSDRFLVADAAGGMVSGALSYDAESFALLFRPSAPLNATSLYTVTISGAVKDQGGGNALGSDLSWSFTTGNATDVTAPMLDAYWPGTSCDCAPTSTRILARLDEIVDPESVTDSTLILADASGTAISAKTRYRGDFLELMPAAELTAGATYTVTVVAGITDLSGNSLASDFSWQFSTDVRAPIGSWTETSSDQPPTAMAFHTAVSTGTQAIFWGWEGGGIYDPGSNQWVRRIGVDQRITPRRDHTAIWTGTEMIVWGGRNGVAVDSEIFNDGGRYDPDAQLWVPIAAPAGTPSVGTYGHVAVWTGTEMIIWGGIANTGYSTLPHAVNTGWRYDPTADTFQAFTGADVPTPRSHAAAIWTGRELIIWGGEDDDGVPLTDGARYDPVANVWTPLPPVDPSIAAGGPVTLLWTGTEAILWNGGRTAANQEINDRFREPTLRFFDPASNSWRASTSGWEPFVASWNPIVAGFAGTGFKAHWTGDRIFIAGLYPRDGSYLYDPVLDSWQAATTTLGLSRQGAASVWTGGRFVFWGGVVSVFPSDSGYVFEP